jgi:hypothetical protein
MAGKDEIESYLVRLAMPFETLGDGIWVLHDEASHGANVVVSYTPPLLLFRVKLMAKPRANAERLYERLLELNATDMTGAAYGIEDGNIVCVESLQAENLDFNEFQAAVESLSVALAEHFPILHTIVAASADKAPQAR